MQNNTALCSLPLYSPAFFFNIFITSSHYINSVLQVVFYPKKEPGGKPCCRKLYKWIFYNPIQDLYDIFSRNCSNLRRKLAKNNTAREKFGIEFVKIRSQALAMKKGLSEDSPKQSIYEYSEFLRTKENELRKLADTLLLPLS